MSKEKIKELHYTKSLCDNWDWFTECEGCNIGISLHCLCSIHLKCTMCDEICSKDFEWNIKQIKEVK